MDWKELSAWPERAFDVVVASDVLYDADAVPHVAAATSRALALAGAVAGAAADGNGNSNPRRVLYTGPNTTAFAW